MKLNDDQLARYVYLGAIAALALILGLYWVARWSLLQPKELDVREVHFIDGGGSISHFQHVEARAVAVTITTYDCTISFRLADQRVVEVGAAATSCQQLLSPLP